MMPKDSIDLRYMYIVHVLQHVLLLAVNEAAPHAHPLSIDRRPCCDIDSYTHLA